MHWRRWTQAASRSCRHAHDRRPQACRPSRRLAVGPPPAAWHFVTMPEPSADDLPLAAEFPAATREQWRQLVADVLKGAPFDQRLVAKTYDGLTIEPLYGRRAQARPIASRAPAATWSVMQRVDHPDAAAANAEALHDLENGATGLSVIFAGATGAYGYGLAAPPHWPRPHRDDRRAASPTRARPARGRQSAGPVPFARRAVRSSARHRSWRRAVGRTERP